MLAKQYEKTSKLMFSADDRSQYKTYKSIIENNKRTTEDTKINFISDLAFNFISDLTLEELDSAIHRLIQISHQDLIGRKFSVRFNGARSKSQRLWAGVPQGSVLSPLLFLIYMDTIHPHIHSDTRIACYADDIAIWHTHRDITTSQKALNVTLKNIAVWAKDLKLSINVDKTNFCVFSTDRKHRGAVSSTNNKAEQECGLPPLENRRNLATIKFANRLHSNNMDHISIRIFNEWKGSTRLKRSSTLQLDKDIKSRKNLEHSSLDFVQESLFFSENLQVKLSLV
ncbi:reverse transcriptase domain-containing protein [Caerostris extrusa]|uniref:Reverse transcriptase domain-containing protein n=1 Tax=Caerostris extrusa TaxID=172846 RepID=A0AAV4PEF7_CAEEX|nr:reverse transcriptase domain-containing protein [Caerostris extrusa]